MKAATNTLISNYALFVMGCAIVAALFNPVSGTAELSPSRLPILSAGALCGGISLLWSYLLARGHFWAENAALISTVIFSFIFTWRAIHNWALVASGNYENFVLAFGITLILLASVGISIRLARESGS